jgi:AAA+ superfamily predicted ATPase
LEAQERLVVSPFIVRPDNSFAEKLANLALSGVQVIQIRTTEETRVLDDIRCAAQLARGATTAAWNVSEWSFLQGYTGFPAQAQPCIGNPLLALQQVGGDAFKVGDDDDVDVRASHVGVVHSADDSLIVVGTTSYRLNAGFRSIVVPGQEVVVGQIIAAPRRDTTFVVYKDITPFLNGDDPRARRALRDLFEAQALNNDQHRRVLVLVSPVPVAHPEVSYLMTNLDYTLPNEAHLLRVVDEIAAGAGTASVDPVLRQQLASAMTGFAHHEACDALAKCVTLFGGLRPRDPAQIEEFTRDLLREVYLVQAASWKNERALTLYDTAAVASFDDIGGYDLLMQWIREIRMCYSEAGKRLKLPTPKGMILAGPPGTGKSVVAKMLAKVLSLPLIMLDVGSVFGSLIGESEATMEHALRRIAAKGRCVVVLDEMDKALGGISNSSGGDSGVGLRVLGKLLSWQANENNDAFVVGTLNTIKNLPPELLRAGRFDAVYFADMPTAAEREEILSIHLRKRELSLYELCAPGEILTLVEMTEGFAGAELEQGVVDAIRRQALQSEGTSAAPPASVLTACLREIVPASRLDPDGVSSIRTFFAGRARPVSNSAKPQAKTGTISRPRRSRSVGGDPGNN